MLHTTLYQRHGAGGGGASGMALGFNLAPPGNLDGTLAFSNLMWLSGGWQLESETNVGTTVWTQANGKLNVTAVTGTAVFRRVLYDNSYLSLADYMPAGTYTVKNANGYSVGIGAYTDVARLAFGTTTADRTFAYTSANGVIALHMQVTATGTYGDGIKVLIPGTDGSDYFSPQFMSFYQGLGSSGGPLRFMQWVASNDTGDTVWVDRALVTDPARDFASGPPWEVCFQLCNRLNRDAWVNIPARADANYVTQLATLAKATLNANLNVWVERGNEIWNTSHGFNMATTWIQYKNHPRYTATVDPTAGVITRAAHGLSNGETVLGFSTKTSISNNISGETASPNGNYYFVAYATPATVSDVTTNTFRLKESPTGAYISFPPVRGVANYATNSVTDLVYIRTADAGSTDLDVNYATQAIADWASFDAVFAGQTSRVKAVMATQVANTGRLATRLGVSGASRFNYAAGAPYFNGLWQICAVDVASGQFTPKIWTTDSSNSTIHYGVYAQGSTPFNYEVENGTGTGYVASSHKTWTATFGSSSAYTPGAAATGMVNGMTYTHCFVITDSNGYKWRLNADIAASASASTVDVPDSYANQNLRNLLYMNDTNMSYIAQAQAYIASSSNPNAKYVNYEFAAGNQDAEQYAPAAALAWMRAQVEDVGFKAVLKLNHSKMAANGVAESSYYYDVGAWGVSWTAAGSYSDTTDVRYVGLTEFAGYVPIYTQMAPGDISAPGITTTPTLPYVITALPNDGTTYSVVKATPSADQYDVNGGNLRLISNVGIDYGATIARTVRLRKSDGKTDTFFNVLVSTGPTPWWEPTATFALKMTTQGTNASLTPDVGAVLTITSGTGGTLSGGYLQSGSTTYSAGTGMTATITPSTPFLIAFAGDIGTAPIAQRLWQFGAGSSLINVTQWSANTVQWEWYAGGASPAQDINSANVSYDGTPAVHWFYHDGAGNVTMGHNQTSDSTMTMPASGVAYAISRNVYLNGQNDVKGSCEVVPKAGMTLADAKVIVQKIQNLHGI